MRNQKSCAKLENWSVVPSANVASYETLQAGNLLFGKVFGHPTIAEGKYIFTSPIVSLRNGSNMVETKNTAYCLGEASSEYRAWSERNVVAA